MDRKVSDKTLDKYKLVIDQYFVNGFNGTKAYQKFYPDASDESADSSFRDIVGISRIEKYISEQYNKAQTSLLTTRKAILLELEQWIYSDITETIMLTPEEVKELPVEIRRLINKFKHTTKTYTDKEGNSESEEVIELQFVSKERAMEILHKHLGFYEPLKIEVDKKDFGLLDTGLIRPES